MVSDGGGRQQGRGTYDQQCQTKVWPHMIIVSHPLLSFRLCAVDENQGIEQMFRAQEPCTRDTWACLGFTMADTAFVTLTMSRSRRIVAVVRRG